jgi:hypothetical protein
LALLRYVEIDQPRRYEQVNRFALDLYRRLLRDEYREYYLVELLYHRVVLLRIAGQMDEAIRMELGREVGDLLASHWAIFGNDSELDSVRNSLQKDPDLKDISGQAISMIEERISVRSEAQQEMRP